MSREMFREKQKTVKTFCGNVQDKQKKPLRLFAKKKQEQAIKFKTFLTTNSWGDLETDQTQF